MKTKALSFHWEFMFARPKFERDDMDEQGRLLNEVSKLVDQGALQNTATKSFAEIDANSLNESPAAASAPETAFSLPIRMR